MKVPMCMKITLLICPSLIKPSIVVSLGLAIRPYKCAFVVSIEWTVVVVVRVVSAADRVILFEFVVLVVGFGVGWLFAFEDGKGFSWRREFSCSLFDDLLFFF